MATFPNDPAIAATNAYRQTMPMWSTMCENCSVRSKIGGHSYCSKTCAAQATKRTQALGAWPFANLQQQPGGDPYSPRNGVMSGWSSYDESTLCQNCLTKSRSTEQRQDGSLVVHPYCGILCYQASQNPTITTPTAPKQAPTPPSVDLDSVSLRAVSLESEIGQKIRLMLEERWDSDEIALRKLKAIYRVNLPGRVYRRFDFALQFNDSCPTITTYCGGIPTCNIANDADPVLCNSTGCYVCEVLQSAFSNLFFDTLTGAEIPGRGLLTDLNPALAHEAVESTSSQQQSSSKKVVLIQCRVVARMYTTGPTNPYVGSIEDSGSVSCYRPTAIIPTHLLIYRARAIPKELSRKGTTAAGPHSPPADLAQSRTTTDSRRRGRANPFEFASSPKASDADPVVPTSAGQPGSTRAQNTQQGFVKITPQRHGSQMYGSNRPSTRPTSMQTPSMRLEMFSSLIAAPPLGANPTNRKPPSAASNTAGTRSPRLHDRSRTPPNGGPLLNAKANPASPIASNPANFSSPVSSGPAPGSGMFSRKTELQKRPVSFGGWGYEAVQSPAGRPKKAMASPSSTAAPFFGESNSANRASYTGPGAASSSGHGNPANHLARDTDSWQDDEDEDEDELDCEPDVLFLVKSPLRSSS